MLGWTTLRDLLVWDGQLLSFERPVSLHRGESYRLGMQAEGEIGIPIRPYELELHLVGHQQDLLQGLR